MRVLFTYYQFYHGINNTRIVILSDAYVLELEINRN